MPRLSTYPTAQFCFYPADKQVESAVKQCFAAEKTRFVYSTKELLSAINKDALPSLQKSNVIYQFPCHCDSQYVGRVSQRLEDKIKRHVLKFIRSFCSSQKHLLSAGRCRSSTKSLASDSAIELHLLQNLVGA